jgi:parallel beta-helix repeat protein
MNNGDYGINLENYQDAELFMTASNNYIIGNVINSHSIGILVENDCDNNVIRGNNITGNTRGFATDVSNNNVIEQNNFIGNTKNVYYRTYWRYHIVFTQNYWDDWHGASKKIILGKTALFPLLPPEPLPVYYLFFIPCFKFDNAPAQEPYDIPGMR